MSKRYDWTDAALHQRAKQLTSQLSDLRTLRARVLEAERKLRNPPRLSFHNATNIDKYVSLLNSDVLLSGDQRTTIISLLITEEDKLGRDLEQLEFAETRVANGRERLKQVKRLRDKASPAIRENAERLVANIEATQKLLEDFCHQLRTKVNSSAL